MVLSSQISTRGNSGQPLRSPFGREVQWRSADLRSRIDELGRLRVERVIAAHRDGAHVRLAAGPRR